jgi:ABC-type uncharacterized transport system substrate-binding protein
MWGAVLVTFVAASGVAPAAAHPHGSIDLRSTVILNADGQVVAIEEEWLYDRLYTQFVSRRLGRDPDERAQAVTELARTNLKRLAPNGYFTYARADDEELKIGEVTEFESAIRDGRIWMRFVAPLATPVDPRRQSFVYSVFDPSYFIAMLHHDLGSVGFRGAGSDACRAELERPRPTAWMTSLAAALDRFAKAPASLGINFAEKISVVCR